MRVIVHFGMSKTGSTSIQKTFTEARETLAAQGILYPVLTRQPHHIYLLPQFFGEGEWKRELGQPLPEVIERVKNTSLECWDKLHAQVAVGDYHTLIISSEHIIGLTAAAKRRLIEALERDFGPVEMVGYIRSPRAHFLSFLQQGLKYNSRCNTPGTPLRYRNKLRQMDKVSSAPLKIRIFSRSELDGGDVCIDFMRQFLDLDPAVVEGMNIVVDNSSLSAEGMALMQEFNHHAWGDHVPFGNATNRTLMRLIQFEETKRPYTKPKLKPEVILAQEAANREDVLWLRDTLGLSFADFDYDGDDTALDIPEYSKDIPLQVADLCHLDEDKLTQMRNVLLKKLITQMQEMRSAQSKSETA